MGKKKDSVIGTGFAAFVLIFLFLAFWGVHGTLALIIAGCVSALLVIALLSGRSNTESFTKKQPISSNVVRQSSLEEANPIKPRSEPIPSSVKKRTYNEWLELMEKAYNNATSQDAYSYHFLDGDGKCQTVTFTEDQFELMLRSYNSSCDLNLDPEREFSEHEIDNICVARKLAERGCIYIPKHPRAYLPDYQDMLGSVDKGDYDKAVEIYYKILNRDTLKSYPKWILPGVRRYEFDELGYLKCLGNIPLTGSDLNLYKPRVSPVIKRYQSEYIKCIDRILEKRRQEGMKVPDEIIIQNMPLIKKVAEEKKNEMQKWEDMFFECMTPRKPRFNQFHTILPDGFFLQDIFGDDQEIIELIHNISIDSENMLRDNHGIPRISEGWISEMGLYNLIKERFPDAKHQVGLPWLKPQRLDVFVPSKNLAIEYNGRQHYEPVEFFGGEKGFEATRDRDQRKRERCEVYGVTLIEWKYTEPITASILEQKLEAISRKFL